MKQRTNRRRAPALLLSALLCASLPLSAAAAVPEAVTREYAVAALAEAAGLAAPADPAAALSAFADADAVSPEYAGALAAAAEAGILRGYGDGTLRPGDALRRVEALALLSRCLPAADAAGKAPALADAPDWAGLDLDRLGSAVPAAEGQGAYDPLTPEDVTRLCALLSPAPADAAVSYLGQGAVGTGWLAGEIYGAVTADTPLSLKDDYATAVNAEYLSSLRMEPGKSSAGVSPDIEKLIEARTLQILTDPDIPGHDAALARTFYDLATDWEARDTLGLAPFLAELDRIAGAETLADLDVLVTRTDRNRSAIGGPAVSEHPAAPGVWSVAVTAAPLVLGDAAEYADPAELGESSRKTLELFQGKVRYLLDRAGWSGDEIQRVLDSYFEVERRLAAHTLTRADHNRDDYYDRISNLLTPAELTALQGNYPMDRVIAARGLDAAPACVVEEPAWLEYLGSELYTEENVPLLRDYFIGDLCTAMIYRLDRAAYDEATALYNRRYGIEGALTEEQIGAAMADSYLSEVLDNVYAETFTSPEDRERVLNLIDELLAAYETMLRGEDWLSPETVENALEKLEHMSRKALYPDTRTDYSALSLVPAAEGGGYLDALEAIYAFNLARNAAKAGSEVDYSLFGSSLRACNAYYDPLENGITILSGMAAGAFDPGNPYPQLLGSLGCVIGHEISHAFDTSGALFDAEGNLNDWWTPADYAAFTERADGVSAYYSQIIPWEGAESVNGDFIRTEAIADLAGMKACLMVAAQHEDFDYDQFFRSYALSWADVYPFDYVEYDHAVDEHPLEYLRINTVVSQFPEFCETYGIAEGDGMYLAPESRVGVW